MNVNVRYFASLREVLGQGESMSLAEELSVGALLVILLARSGENP